MPNETGNLHLDRPKVLLIDDDGAVLEALALLLEAKGTRW